MQLGESLQPLTCGRELGDCLVAGMTFRELRASLVRELAGGEDVVLAENAWIAPEVLKCLLEPSPPTLVIGDDVVARVASSSEEHIDVSDSGVLVRYPWDFLTLQERVLGRVNEPRVEGEVHARATVDGIVVLGEGSRILPGVYIDDNLHALQVLIANYPFHILDVSPRAVIYTPCFSDVLTKRCLLFRYALENQTLDFCFEIVRKLVTIRPKDL